MKIWGVRFSLIGDMIMSLPVLEVLEKQNPNSFKYFSVAKKCAQAVPLLQNHPLINQIKVSDFDEALGPTDLEIIKTCDLAFDVKPQHPNEQDWYNHRSCVEETALMAGIHPDLVKGIKPKLYLTKEVVKNRIHPTIAIWPFAGYGLGLDRSPSKEWWEKTVALLIDKGFQVFHFGASNEPKLSKSMLYSCLTFLDFHTQVEISLESVGCIGTDSGSMWVLGAYHYIPQINLLTNWLPNHNRNHLALAPEGEKCVNLFAEGGCSNISHELVMEKVNENFRI